MGVKVKVKVKVNRDSGLPKIFKETYQQNYSIQFNLLCIIGGPAEHPL